MRFKDLTDRQRQMILARELSDDVIAVRLGVTRRSVMRFRERLSMASMPVDPGTFLPVARLVRAFFCLPFVRLCFTK